MYNYLNFNQIYVNGCRPLLVCFKQLFSQTYYFGCLDLLIFKSVNYITSRYILPHPGPKILPKYKSILKLNQYIGKIKEWTQSVKRNALCSHSPNLYTFLVFLNLVINTTFFDNFPYKKYILQPCFVKIFLYL